MQESLTPVAPAGVAAAEAGGERHASLVALGERVRCARAAA
jgi:XRE family aerobic/anaerobic benzoate catabolism transcriptional regulator